MTGVGGRRDDSRWRAAGLSGCLKDPVKNSRPVESPAAGEEAEKERESPPRAGILVAITTRLFSARTRPLKNYGRYARLQRFSSRDRIKISGLVFRDANSPSRRILSAGFFQSSFIDSRAFEKIFSGGMCRKSQARRRDCESRWVVLGKQ